MLREKQSKRKGRWQEEERQEGREGNEWRGKREREAGEVARGKEGRRREGGFYNVERKKTVCLIF